MGLNLLQKKNIQNVMLMLSSILFTLVCVEIGFRYGAYLSDQKTLAQLEDQETLPTIGEEVHFGQMIRLSRNPKIIYDFKPNLSVSFLGQPVTINENGFRGKKFPIDKEEGTIRILGIGDSQMFGWGVKDDETYLSVLTDSLNHHYPNVTWETINTSVPGYNTVMELETLKEKGLAYQPDYVVVGFVANDFALPNFIREQEDYFTLKKYFTLAYFKANLKPIGLKNAPVKEKRRSFESNPKKVPPQYRDMVGEKGVRNALEELHRISLLHNFPVVVFLDNRRIELNIKGVFLKEICDELAFHFITGYDLWEEFALKNKIPNPQNARFLSDTDPHASALSHRATGQRLFRFWKEEFIDKAEFSRELSNQSKYK